jgi:titin
VIGGSGFVDNTSWSRGYGITIVGDSARGNAVEGNLIGTNAQGNAALTNNAQGVDLESNGNLVGGTTPGARNIIAGNTLEGMTISGDSNIVQGNYIGTDITGTNALPNATGIAISYAFRNVVGGRTQGAGNLISGNAGSGVVIVSSGAENRVEGNLIGTQEDGISPLGNQSAGVFLGEWASHNTIGGSASEAANTIAFNAGHGVELAQDSIGNRVSRNSIYANGKLGINLKGGVEDSKGVTINDQNDADTGPNDLQNYPVLTTGIGGDYLDLSGFLGSKPNSMYTLEFYATPPEDPASNGEGQAFI